MLHQLITFYVQCNLLIKKKTKVVTVNKTCAYKAHSNPLQPECLFQIGYVGSTDRHHFYCTKKLQHCTNVEPCHSLSEILLHCLHYLIYFIIVKKVGVSYLDSVLSKTLFQVKIYWNFFYFLFYEASPHQTKTTSDLIMNSLFHWFDFSLDNQLQ